MKSEQVEEAIKEREEQANLLLFLYREEHHRAAVQKEVRADHGYQVVRYMRVREKMECLMVQEDREQQPENLVTQARQCTPEAVEAEAAVE